jgi:hypothetical protein
VLLAAAGGAAAETKTYEITVSAGKTDRVNDPVTVQLAVPEALAKITVVRVASPDGGLLTGQLTGPGLLAEPAAAGKGEVARELHFIVGSLKAGDSATFKVTLSDTERFQVSGDAFSWDDTKGEHADLLYGKRPVMRYVYKALDESTKESREQTFKVFHHLYDPAGKRIVTNGPSGLYPHHRGLFYGFMKVTYDDKKTVDTWHCKGDAYQGHEKFLAVEAGPVLGRHRVEVGWHGERKETFAVEQREMTVYAVPGGTLVEFASRLDTRGGTVKLDGDPQHAGFHFRADNEVNEKTKAQTYYLRPDGQGKPGETRNWPDQKDHVNLPWDAMSFVLGDQRYTVAYLDRPTNPKEARFSERDYGRFGSYFVTEVTEKNPLKVNYRVWLQEGEMKGDQVAALDNEFVAPAEVKVK